MSKSYIPQIQPGIIPGTLQVSPNAQPTEITIMLYNAANCETHTVEDLFEQRITHTDDAVLWVQVTGLQNLVLIKKLGEHFQLHPLALEDTLNTHQRSKVDNFTTYEFIVSRIVTVDAKDDLQRQQISMYLGKNFVLSFLERPSPLTELLQTRLQNAQSRLRLKSADYLVYEILDYVTDSFFPVMSATSTKLDLLEHQVMDASNNNSIRAIQLIKRRLRFLKIIMWSHRDMISSMLRNDLSLIRPESVVFFRDCYDHVIQQIDILESERESTNSLVDIYLSSMANRVNQVMKVLTVISVIFMPPTFLAAVWGMNFIHMPELHWRFGYIFGWLMMIGSSAGTFYAFWRKGWLSKSQG